MLVSVLGLVLGLGLCPSQFWSVSVSVSVRVSVRVRVVSVAVLEC